MNAGSERELDPAFADLRVGRALLVVPTYFAARRDQIIALAAPAVPRSTSARVRRAGGLMSYGPTLPRLSQAGIYAGRILNGEKPADLPVKLSEVRTGDQPQDRKGAGSCNPTGPAGARRRGDRGETPGVHRPARRAAAAWPVVALAQRAEPMRRFGVLVGLAENDPEMKERLAGFRQGLEKLGWSEGSNVKIDYRFAPAGTRVHLLARELVASQPDVILAQSTPATAALKPETSTIPIVFAGVADPIGSGFVASLSRPSGNLTGLLQYEEGITGKWLAMLKEIAPNLTRAALLANPRTAAYDYFLRSAKTLAPSLAIEVVPMPIENANDIERSIKGFAREPNGGLVLPPDTTTVIHRDLIIT